MMGNNRDKQITPSKITRRKLSDELPLIPDKRYFTIGEVAFLCGVKPHVLRYWEQEFPQIQPIKRRGNRRYYQNKDVLLIRNIRTLLYENKFTIEGARSQLVSMSVLDTPVQSNEIVKKIIADLEAVLQELKTEKVMS
ncbi:MAG TPA: MerR family transcriptional regulator [Candidatus Babeliaceae bacterium]|nr:MerR family transcriptional regulator [Candidatus Babeliaceae bacterium]